MAGLMTCTGGWWGIPSCRPAGSFTTPPAARRATLTGAGVRSAGGERNTAGADDVWRHRDAEALRALELVAIRRLIGATRGLPNAPSDWDGWSIIDPNDEKKRYAARRAAGLCTRCGQHPPRPGRKLCETCAAAASVRSLELRVRRRGAAICIQCGAAETTGGHARCETCRRDVRNRA